MAIKKDKPKVEVPFPPTGHAAQHRVVTGQNWAELARIYHINDPLKILFFNFPGATFREVNWYLEKKVGCTQSADGKNYRFDSTDIPGVVYIPPPDFVPPPPPPPSLPKGVEVPALTSGVKWTLYSTALFYIDFNFGGTYIDTPGYFKLANLIDAGRLLVRHTPERFTGGKSNGEYDSSDDTLHFKFSAVATDENRGLVIHEATHALCDYYKAFMSTASSEAAAYIAQCVYMRERSLDPEIRLTSPHPAKDLVYKIGWEIAGKLIAGESLSSNDEVRLKCAVLNHPAYKVKVGEEGSILADYDGIKA